MINENEERFLASESLKGILEPEMLEDAASSKGEFCLVVGNVEYQLNVYLESSDSLTLIFNCKDNMLSPLLSMPGDELVIKCAESTITRDLSRHDPSWDIIRITPNEFIVTLVFSRNNTGLING